MEPHGTADSRDFSARQEQVGLRLAAGRSVKSVAAELGVGVRTIYDWLDDPQYRLLVSKFRRRMIDRAVGSLARSTNKAVLKLRKLLDSENENVVLRASLGMLEAAVRMREHGELEERITVLELIHEQSNKNKEAGANGDGDGCNGCADIIKTWLRP
jgi:hypothetical protein